MKTRTTREWEASDIDLENNDIHSHLAAVCAIVMLEGMIQRKRIEMAKENSSIAGEVIKHMVASILNTFEDENCRVALVPREPTAIERGMLRDHEDY